MPLHAVRLAALLFTIALVSPAASSPRLSNTQYQFLEAVRKGQVQKARDLIELANLNPMNFDGQPFIRWAFQGDGQLNAMTDETFDYVFKELKQPFNTPQNDSGVYSTFAMFCANTGAGTYDTLANVTGLQRTQNRINFALANGASPRHLPNLTWAHRSKQPLPRCVGEYFSWRHNPQARSIMLAIIDTLIKEGADPNYDWPLAAAAEKYDTQLFQALVDNGARPDHVFPVSHDIDTCRNHGLPPNTIIAKLPHPRDQDVQLAKPFLEALQDAGVDIMEKQNHVRFSVKCRREHVTLVERALATGQTAYAKMVLDLAKSRSVANVPPTHTPTATPNPAALPRGSRIVTSSFNVRERPALDGALMSTLGANAVFDVEDASPDGQWTRINVPPIVRGWANTAVIARSSVPNEPVSGAPPITASLAAPKPDAATLQQKMLFLVTALDGPPYREVEKFFNAHGVHVRTTATVYEATFTEPCVLQLRTIPKTEHHTQTPQPIDIGNTPYTRLFDFRKMVRVNAEYTDSPDEGIMYGFAGGASNPRLRKPRKINYLTYFGDGSACSVKSDGTVHSCNTDGKPGGHAALPNPAKRPRDFEGAFKIVKSSCQ